MNRLQIPGPGWKLLIEGTYADLYIIPREAGEPLVIKVLRELEPAFRRAFAREGRVLMESNHPGIVRALGGDLKGERPYYYMPYFSGGALTKRAGKLDRQVLRSVAQWFAAAIATLHARDIAHGDIKPDNVFITKDGTMLVGDPLGNGSGCTITIGTKVGGTQGYWAPEIANGSPISKKGDVFSLGATIFHLATGVVPQDGMSLDPAAYGVNLPDDLQRILSMMCQRDPRRRPSMLQIVAALAPKVESRSTRILATNGREAPAWLKAIGVTLLAAAALTRSTKSWDSNVQRYRGTGGKFRGGGLFE